MQYLTLIGALAVVLVTGFIGIRKKVASLLEEYRIIEEFHDKFVQLLEAHDRRQFNNELYNWLVLRMDKVQFLMGSYGIGYYSAPFNRFEAKNYQYIVNTIPKLRMNMVQHHELMMCDDMLVRYIGAVARRMEDQEKLFKKPFVWLQLGIQFYISLPVRLLYWFGIINNNSLGRITSSQVFKVLAGIGGLVGFLASLVQILQAWPSILGLF